jgi:hypothetical protein
LSLLVLVAVPRARVLASVRRHFIIRPLLRLVIAAPIIRFIDIRPPPLPAQHAIDSLLLSYPNTRGAGPNAAVHVLRLSLQSSVHDWLARLELNSPILAARVTL